MSAQPRDEQITPMEYLEREAHSDLRHEFINGAVRAMSGASRNHAVISGNIFAAVRSHGLSRGCMTFQADMNVLAAENHYYPDVVTVCGEESYLEGAPIAVLRNPVLIVEVLSPSTAKDDRSVKLDDYRTIPSLREYLMVWQDVPRVDLLSRHEDNAWLTRRIDGQDAHVTLPALDLTLSLRDIYAHVIWENP